MYENPIYKDLYDWIEKEEKRIKSESIKRGKAFKHKLLK